MLKRVEIKNRIENLLLGQISLGADKEIYMRQERFFSAALAGLIRDTESGSRHTPCS
jgi:hypothetical protein